MVVLNGEEWRIFHERLESDLRSQMISSAQSETYEASTGRSRHYQGTFFQADILLMGFIANQNDNS